MFNNLIESSSHVREFKRRGSFLLFTTAAYTLLFVIAGIASVYAYDAHLDQEENEVITMLQPVIPLGPPKAPDHIAATLRTPTKATPDFRPVLMASVDNTKLVPTTVSAEKNPILPVRDGGVITAVGPQQDGTGPLGPAGPSFGNGGGGTIARTVVADVDKPPPPAAPVKIVRSTRVLNSEALSLPKPNYPSLAKQARAFGTVSVQILIDEQGKVVSAHALSGSPLLTAEAVRAAYLARFSPTILGDSPVKVSGIINYNFVLQ
jgi:protein TonB